MKKIVLSLFLIGAFGLTGISQFWTENFNSGSGAAGTPANGYTSPNGTWTMTDLGSAGAFPNNWYVSDEESGVAVNNCGNAGLGNPTLHVGNMAGSPGGLCPAGDCGAAYDASTNTETIRRIESPIIDCSGQTTITLEFKHIGFGEPPQDGATAVYSDNGGATWNPVSLVALTSQCCCLLPGFCGGPDPIPCSDLLSGQGYWQTLSFALPASCDGNPNVKIGFLWVNDGNNAGSDPSCAIDDITLTGTPSGGPTASFTTPVTTICVGTCIDFTNTSTGGPFTATDWTFTGATPNNSAVNNPTNICYNTAGTFAVELSVTDASGTDVETVAGYITVVDAPDAGGDGASNLCNDATLNLNTLLSGADAGGVWAETSGTPSGQFTAGTGVLDGNALTPGNIYTFTYTVAPTAPCVGNDVSTFTITIIDCSAGTPPTAAFTASQTTICAGECITFTDNSTPGDITDWGWDFGGGAIPNNAIGQNPGSICFNTAGTYTVTLGVVNPAGTDDATVTITVNALPSVTANAAPASTICAGDPVTLSGGGATSYVWTGGVTNGVAFNPASTGTYTVTGTDANGCENTVNITVTVDICEPMIAGFSYNDNICAGDCITLTDTTTGVPIAWNWDFGGGATPNTSTDQNPVVCFTSPGTFNIQLTTTDAGGNNSSTTNSISVFGLPTVTAQLDTIVDIGHEVILDATGSGSGTYLWTPDEGDIACDTCANTTAYPLVNTDFIVYYTDVNGCMAQDTVFVIVNFIEGIGVPQAFSPNGDGHNDVLFVKGFGIIQMKFSVYNRYGQQVFETTDQNIGWDGTFKGRDENPGVFVWVLEYTLIDNISSGVISGNTTLIR